MKPTAASGFGRGLVLASALLLGGCAARSTADPAHARVLGGQAHRFTVMASGSTSHLPADVQRYLDDVHGLLHEGWSVDVLLRASYLLPAASPANRPERRVVLEMALDMYGQPGPVSVVSRSGYPPFDESAMQVMTSLRKLPPLPASLGEGHVYLRWAFHRDQRACSPENAGFMVVRLTPAEALARALKRSDYGRAASILKMFQMRRSLVAEVVQAGLADRKLIRRLKVLPLANTDQLLELCRAHGGQVMGNAALQELAGRGDASPLLALLAEALAPVPGKKAAPVRWLVSLLEGVARTQGRVKADLLTGPLGASEPELVLAAAALASAAAQLDAVLPRWEGRPEVAGPLHVRRCLLAPTESCLEAISRHVAGPQPLPTIRALRRTPVPGAVDALASLVSRGEDPAARVEAIRTLVAYKEQAPLGTLFSALRSDDQLVAQAAARAVGLLGRKPLGSSYRLAEVGYQDRRSPLAAEVMAAIARLGEGRFMEEVIRLQRQMPTRRRSRIIANLWGFGEPARPYLQKLVSEGTPQLVHAARASLARLDGVEPAPAREVSAPQKAQSLDDVIRMALAYKN